MKNPMRYPDRRGEGRRVRISAAPQARTNETHRDPVIIAATKSMAVGLALTKRGPQHIAEDDE